MLLVRANEAVSTDALLEALWPGGPPARALNAVQVHVSGLRKLLGPAAARLETHHTGYVLTVEPGELDSDRFAELVAEAHAAAAAGDHAHAAGLLRNADGLWYGEPLADVRYEPFAQAEIARLEELRLAAREERIEAELVLGHPAEVVAELEALVAEHPLRERLRGQLMLALYRGGRQAEALAVYQDARRALVDELGIDPSPPLRELEAAILRQDESLALPPGAEALRPVPPAAPEPLVGAAAREGGRLAARSETRKVVSVLFCDIADSTGLGARLDPEALRQVMTRYFELAAGILERHGATVEKFIGDAVMAVFGIPLLHEDDALRAVRAAVELRDALPALNDELERGWGVRVAVRIGINTGEVVTGDGRGGHVLVTGDAVNLAARLEQEAAPGHIVIGPATWRLVRDAVAAEPLEGFRAKGRDGVVEAYAVGALDTGDSRGEPTLASPMIGRVHERALLAGAFERATRERACHLVTILGAAGIGKSRLVGEVVVELSDRASVLRGRCLAYGDGITYWPAVELVREAAGLGGDEEAGEVRARVAALVGDDPDAGAVAERVAEVLGLAEPGGSADETAWAVRRFLEAIARRRPLVVVLDDVQWAEPTFLDLVEHVVDWSHDAPIVVVCMARPDLLEARPTWAGGKLNATSMLLEPLSPDEVRELVGNLLGTPELAEPARARVVAAADGNPLFVEETLAMLIDEGVLRADGERFVQVGDVGSIAVPATIQALLGARLDRLGPDERDAIERAAVAGKIFSQHAVEALAADCPELDVGAQLRALVRKELIRPESSAHAGEEAFRFRHILIQDAAYAAMPKRIRARLHERFASWIDEQPGEGGRDELAGHHLEQALLHWAELGPLDERAESLRARAAERLTSAGLRATARGDMPAAASLLERAAALLPEGTPERLAVLPELGRALRETGDLARSDAVLTGAIDESRAHDDSGHEMLAALERAALRTYTDPACSVEELRRLAGEAIGDFERLGNDTGLAKAWSLASDSHWVNCRFAEMEEAVERALVHAERAGDRRKRGDLLARLAGAALLGPTPADEALARCDELLRRADGDRAVEAFVLVCAGWLEAMRDDADRARVLAAESKAILEELGVESWIAEHAHYAGPIELLAGDPAAAEAELRRGLELLEAIGDRARISTQAAFLAQAVYAQGDLEEAERLAVRAASAAADDTYAHVVWRGTLARVAARQGDRARAEEFAHEAVARAERTDGLNLLADALADLAEVLSLAGCDEAAADAASRARRLYRRKGNVAALARRLSGPARTGG